jgi:SAM-dependent methyltransferase
MASQAASEAEESFWVRRLAGGAGFCCHLGSGPGQVIEGFWRDVFGSFRPGSRVLEIGCGSGEVSIWAAEAGRGLKIVASDIHDRPEIVQKHPDVSFLAKARAEALPVEASSFDLVVSNFAFEYAVDRETAVGELARVLHPGGSAAFVLHSDDSAVTASSRDLLAVHQQLAAADIPERVTRAAALRADHLSRRKLLKDVLKLRAAFPAPATGLSAGLYFELAERLLKGDPAARKDLENLEAVVARLVDMSVAQVRAALDAGALSQLQRQCVGHGLEAQTSEITGAYETGVVQKVGWLMFVTKRG